MDGVDEQYGAPGVHPCVHAAQVRRRTKPPRAELKRFNVAAVLDATSNASRRRWPKPIATGWRERLSYLDFYAVVFLRWGELAGIDPESLPQYKAYVDRIAALAPLAAALKREGLPLHMYKKA